MLKSYLVYRSLLLGSTKIGSSHNRRPLYNFNFLKSREEKQEKKKYLPFIKIRTSMIRSVFCTP